MGNQHMNMTVYNTTKYDAVIVHGPSEGGGIRTTLAVAELATMTGVPTNVARVQYHRWDRHDFGAVPGLYSCATCGCHIWNRGCAGCEKRFCPECFLSHRSGVADVAAENWRPWPLPEGTLVVVFVSEEHHGGLRWVSTVDGAGSLGTLTLIHPCFLNGSVHSLSVARCAWKSKLRLAGVRERPEAFLSTPAGLARCPLVQGADAPGAEARCVLLTSAESSAPLCQRYADSEHSGLVRYLVDLDKAPQLQEASGGLDRSRRPPAPPPRRPSGSGLPQRQAPPRREAGARGDAAPPSPEGTPPRHREAGLRAEPLTGAVQYGRRELRRQEAEARAIFESTFLPEELCGKGIAKRVFEFVGPDWRSVQWEALKGACVGGAVGAAAASAGAGIAVGIARAAASLELQGLAQGACAVRAVGSNMGFIVSGAVFALEVGVGLCRWARGDVHGRTLGRLATGATVRFAANAAVCGLAFIPFAGPPLCVVAGVVVNVSDACFGWSDQLAEWCVPLSEEEQQFYASKAREALVSAAAELLNIERSVYAPECRTEAERSAAKRRLRKVLRKWMSRLHPDKNDGRQHAHLHTVQAAFVILDEYLGGQRITVPEMLALCSV